ncbi:dTMP kinase [Candidatus Bathyarchaeota archaeon]|nr:dTMP kinase [Candidatus Bathyarchaeota archaeon]
MNGKGAFIAFEGIDGSGKSTLVRLTYEMLSRRGLQAVRTKEPSSGPIGRFIRAQIGEMDGRMSAWALALLFAADRLDHAERLIRPSLERGLIVLSDRYLYSSLAYQGAEGVSWEWIRELNRLAPKPDLCILLDVSPETGMRRIGGRPKTIFENERLQERVRRLYLELVEEGEIIRVDAERPLKEVQRDVNLLVQELLKGRGIIDSKSQ